MLIYEQNFSIQNIFNQLSSPPNYPPGLDKQLKQVHIKQVFIQCVRIVCTFNSIGILKNCHQYIILSDASKQMQQPVNIEFQLKLALLYKV